MNQLEIHNPICESTKDSCHYIEINTGFHALEGNHYSNINMNHINLRYTVMNLKNRIENLHFLLFSADEIPGIK